MLNRTYSLPSKTSVQLLDLAENAKDLKIDNTPFRKLARSMPSMEAKAILKGAIKTIDRMEPSILSGKDYELTTKFLIPINDNIYRATLTMSKKIRLLHRNPIFEIRNTISNLVLLQNGVPKKIPPEYLSAERLLAFIDTRENKLEKEYFIVSAFSKDDKLNSDAKSLTNEETKKTSNIHDDYNKNKHLWWNDPKLKVFLEQHIDESILQ
ncbi:hypothetical protein OZX56_05490 [Lactobacillus sp. ESL0684]|uniref:hypothetical protein n=1 Tax=Lactobacillus sp. ESL0684 TaxID=2983213 RepID=UPI0023F6B379|nr:hypothetical protein [Lactobacillus sp. ESL0684]WEV43002.1 hypothetical protein OZX56_05490 [Lactobacillus sp. ESL0684]